jgi:hypothetical protein
MFYQLGGLQTWELTCELFEYSNEQLNTGIFAIDNLQTERSTNILDYSITDEEGNYITDENGDFITSELYNLEEQNPGTLNETLNVGSENFQTGSNDFIDFSTVDPFSEGNI